MATAYPVAIVLEETVNDEMGSEQLPVVIGVPVGLPLSPPSQLPSQPPSQPPSRPPSATKCISKSSVRKAKTALFIYPAIVITVVPAVTCIVGGLFYEPYCMGIHGGENPFFKQILSGYRLSARVFSAM